jgi:hypothetical protein
MRSTAIPPFCTSAAGSSTQPAALPPQSAAAATGLRLPSLTGRLGPCSPITSASAAGGGATHHLPVSDGFSSLLPTPPQFDPHLVDNRPYFIDGTWCAYMGRPIVRKLSANARCNKPSSTGYLDSRCKDRKHKWSPRTQTSRPLGLDRAEGSCGHNARGREGYAVFRGLEAGLLVVCPALGHSLFAGCSGCGEAVAFGPLALVAPHYLTWAYPSSTRLQGSISPLDCRYSTTLGTHHSIRKRPALHPEVCCSGGR